ncbi:hypothetical protein FKW77_002920 [Venturia effusa]|uniref:Uncharacterized protein n=1 Tax=Venturia effusa TaxID=50376 RepID=A0A517LMF6_9PEZI|nr:hypothetical protein FKW77_002920 [Venturia effusa]
MNAGRRVDEGIVGDEVVDDEKSGEQETGAHESDDEQVEERQAVILQHGDGLFNVEQPSAGRSDEEQSDTGKAKDGTVNSPGVEDEMINDNKVPAHPTHADVPPEILEEWELVVTRDLETPFQAFLWP